MTTERVLPNIALIGQLRSGKSTLAQMLVREHGYKQAALAARLKELLALILGRPLDKNTDRESMQALGNLVGRNPDFVGMENAREMERSRFVSQILTILNAAGSKTSGSTLDSFAGRARAHDALRMALWPHKPEQVEFSKFLGRPSCWVNLLHADLVDAGFLVKNEGKTTEGKRRVPIVVDDVRMPNEAESLAKWGFILVRVVTPIETIRERAIAADGRFDENWMLNESEKDVGSIPCAFQVHGTGSTIESVRHLLWQIEEQRLGKKR